MLRGQPSLTRNLIGGYRSGWPFNSHPPCPSVSDLCEIQADSERTIAISGAVAILQTLLDLTPFLVSCRRGDTHNRR